MNFATWSVRNPVPSILIFGLLTLAGLWGFNNLNVQSFPDLDLPTVNVVLTQPGAAPAQLETEVARKVEDAIATLQGLKRVSTTIMDGRVSMRVEFVLGRPLSDSLLDVKDAIDRARNDLPTELEEPQVSADTVGDNALLVYAVSHAQMNEEALSWFVDDTIARAVLNVPGTGAFARLGGVQREVRVVVDPSRLIASGVTATDVSRALRQVQQEASGGRGQLGGAEQGVRTIATVQRAEDLAALPITLANGRSLRLDQIATVEDTVADRSQAASLNGNAVVGFQLSRTKGFDETRLAAGVEQALAALQRQNPGLKLHLVRSEVDEIAAEYRGSMEMLIEGALLAILVIWVFLRDWRATVIGAAALPLSIIPAFAVMYWAGYSLNTITLLALAVVVGILVDDAIVEVENIARHLRLGKSIRQATLEAVNEIALAVLATTATLVAVFLPTAFMSGVSGLFFKQFGWTAVAAVVASLAVARMITPILAVWILRSGHEEPPEGRMLRTYLRCAEWCLHHRGTTAIAATVFFLASLALVPLLPTGFIGADDNGVIDVSMELPPGSSLQTSVETAEQARLALQGITGIKAVFTTIGNAQGVGPNLAPAEVRRGTLTLLLSPRGDRPDLQTLQAMLQPRLAEVPGARFSVGGDFGSQLRTILASQDAHALKLSAQALEADLRTVSFLSGVTSTASLERPEITIRPDAARAAERGVSTQAIGETVRIALAGDFDASLAKLNLDRRQIDIRVQVPAGLREDLNAISALRVPGREGLVPLDSVAVLSLESGPSQIDRYNRERQVTITADLSGTPIGDAIQARDNLPAVRNLPSSVHIIAAGDAEFVAELFSGFGMAMLIGILCVYSVLVLLFKDWFHPITILSAVPLSVGGAFVALLLVGSELGLPALIGLVMLLGIVTKNSILLVDFAVMAQRDHGMSLHDALMDACRKRVRPIVMTTVAMVAGMLPLALGIGGDSPFRQPMSIAVIGGLITSTALSLLVVPVVFTYIAGLERRLKSRFGLPIAAAPTTPPAAIGSE